jgi:hypothetical protein
MKYLVQELPFIVGTTFGAILCFVLNYLTYLNNWCNENIYDCFWFVGFPVPFGRGQGGHFGFDGFIWLGLVTDVCFALTASLLVGWGWTLTWYKIKDDAVTKAGGP